MNTTAQAYFAAHAAEAQTAYADPLYEARKIKKGDKMVVGSGLKFATRAKEDGWLLKSMSGDASAFLTKAEFARAAVAEVHTIGDERTEITSDYKVRAVKKGQQIVAYPFGPGLGVQDTAGTNAYLVGFPDAPDAPRYFSETDFKRQFRNPGEKPATITFYRSKDLDPKDETQMIVLKEDTTFAFKAGECEGKAGDVLYVNSKDEDGYTVSRAAAVKYVLRTAPQSTRPGVTGHKPSGAQPS
jgi:hypothetical protein